MVEAKTHIETLTKQVKEIEESLEYQGKTLVENGEKRKSDLH